MPKLFDSAAATSALATLELGAVNRELADYWLSLWQGGRLPARGAVDPVRLKKFLPGLSILEIHPDESVRYRIAGQAFRAAYGFDPSGRDVIQMTPPAQRAARLARFKSFVAGHVGAAIRVIPRGEEPDVISQDLVLPLGGRAADGARTWIFHNSWRPAKADWPRALPPAAVGMIDGFVTRALA